MFKYLVTSIFECRRYEFIKASIIDSAISSEKQGGFRFRGIGTRNENAASFRESMIRDETSTDDLSTDDTAARGNTRAREGQNARLLARAIAADR